MELKATALGRNLARHPYHRVRLLPAGIEASGDKHNSVIPFKDLVAVRCKRGLVWGELEFELPDEQVVRLHGTDWQETRQFHHQLMQHWLQWDIEVIPIAQELLNAQAQQLYTIVDNLQWLRQQDVAQIITDIHITLRGLPLPEQRLPELIQCAAAYAICQQWLSNGEQIRQQHNDRCYEILSQNHSVFFNQFNPQQGKATLCSEEWIHIEGVAGTGKSELLLAKMLWLLTYPQQLEPLQLGPEQIEAKKLEPQQIVLLVNNPYAVKEMTKRLQLKSKGAYGTDNLPQIMTFTEAALQLAQFNSKQAIKLSRLEQIDEAEKLLLTQCWQQQCSTKRAYQQGWRQWLTEEMGWSLTAENFWQDPALIARLVPRLQRWLQLQRMDGKSQKDIIARATEQQRPSLQKQLRLLAPLLKAWRSHVKEEKAMDSYRILKIAAERIQGNRKNLPWRYLLVDDLQNTPPLAIELLAQLMTKGGVILMSAEDPEAGHAGFSSPTQQLHELLCELIQSKQIAFERVLLTLSYRPPQAFLTTARHFLDPYGMGRKQLVNNQVNNQLQSDQKIIALPQEMLSTLLDKLSGIVSSHERVVILLRYAYMQPECLQQKVTRWPRLPLDVLPIECCDSLEADIVIIYGLNRGEDGFPVSEGITLLEETLLPASAQLPAGREQRLCYQALTRAKKQLWLLYDIQQPSWFIEQLEGYPIKHKKRP